MSNNNHVVSLFRPILRKFGFDVIRYMPNRPGRFPLEDISRFILTDEPIIFDVGANIGQTVHKFFGQFPNSIIHSFEPSPTTFATLQQNVGKMHQVYLWNIACGSKIEQRLLQENVNSDMSSFLQLDKFGWGKIKKETIVPITTIDQFCEEQKIDRIDLLKIDTQGFDFEVIKGAKKLIDKNKIGLLFFEIIFSEQYEDLPRVTEIFDYLLTSDFKLVTLYPFSYQKGLASWTDGLFIHKSYLSRA